MSKTILTILGGSLLLALAGCRGADGTDGTNGTNGVDGTNGTNGTNGTDGANGTDGTDGADGHDGKSGHNGTGPWGINLDIISIEGGTGTGGAFQVGDYPTITYTLTDDDGVEYDLADLTGFSFQMAGPTSHYQIAVYSSDLAKVATTSIYDWSDNTWTYTFDKAIPATYHAVPNDTAELGVDDGDLGGQPLVDGTYTIAAWAYIRQTLPDDSTYYEADNATNDVLFGSATAIEPREVVLAENCAQCHGDQFMAHGGSRRDLAVCLTCHVDGAEDRYSATDGTTTPGATVGMTSMMHKIHMGAELTNGVVYNGYPADATAEGYPNYNAVDFSDVGFPAWPQGPATCAQCHAGAAGGDVEARPTRLACGSCHDNIDFTVTDTTAPNYHPGGALSDDSTCTVCHSESKVVGYHEDPRDDTTFNKGLNLNVVKAYNQDGDTTFDIGDTIYVEFNVTYDDGTAMPSAKWAYSSTSSTCGTVAGSATAILSGPTNHMERIMYSPSPSSSTTVGSVYGSSTYDSTTKNYTYKFQTTAAAAQTLPATYPAQLNDTAHIGLEQGDWYGQPLVSGTYRIGMDIYTTLWEDPTGACSRQRVADSDFIDVLVGTATTIEPREVIDESGCENCHTVIEFHGSGRVGVNYCIMCHTVGSEDSTSVNPDTQVDFPNMIHKIHGSSILENGYCVGSDCFEVAFPRQDGGVKACVACHGDNTEWQEPTTRGCITCHDSEGAAAHAAIMTDDTRGESCDVCHGTGAESAVEKVHAFPE